MQDRTITTAGLRLLSAIIRDVSITSLRDLDVDNLFAEKADAAERRVYNFIARHHKRHKVLPTRAVLGDNLGVRLPKVDQPIAYYLERVRQRAMLRGLIEPYQRIGEALQRPRTSVSEVLSAVDDLLTLKNRFIDVAEGLDLSDSVLEALNAEYLSRKMSGGAITGITTGWEPLDVIMDGYNTGDLVVWVGRPGRSKSWMLLKQAYAAWVAGYKPLYVSMEMGSMQNMRRLLGIHSGINPTLIKRGMVQTLSESKLFGDIAALQALRPLHMVTSNFSRKVAQIANMIDKYTPDIVYIDAGYLLSPMKKRYGSGGRRESIADVAEELKALAGDSGIPIVITVQFNRSADQRRRSSSPTDGAAVNPIAHLSLSEIGETDVIGQVASHVIGIEYPPYPLDRASYRVFGFLKGREGESGWWLTNFMPTRTAPVNLDIVPMDDPVYSMLTPNGAAGAPAVDPNRRMALLGLQD